MDDLKQVWQEFKIDTSDLTDFSENEIRISIGKKSNGIMETLKKKVLTKLYFCLFFTLVFAVYTPFANPLPSKILLLILLAAYIIGDILLYQEWKELQTDIEMDQDLRSNMVAFRDRIKKVIKYEELIGLSIYPISATAGFMIGMVAAGDGSYMDEQKDWIALVVVLIVLTPLAHWLAKSMNRRTFGSYLNKLESNILELEKAEKA